MLKSMIVILAMLGSMTAQATVLVVGVFDAVQDQKAVGAVFVGSFDAVQDQKAVGALYTGLWPRAGAVQDQKAVGALYTGNWEKNAVQDQKAVGVGAHQTHAIHDQKTISNTDTERQVEAIQVIDLNEGF